LSAQNPAYAPDGRTLLFTEFVDDYNNGDSGLWVLAPGGSPKRLLFVAGNDAVNLPGSAWNVKLDRIAFAGDFVTTDDIYTIAPNGTDLRRLTNAPAADQALEPSISPDGAWIAFELDFGDPDSNAEQSALYVMRSNGTGLRRLRGGPHTGRDDREPNWSPAGNRIVFQERVLPNDQNHWALVTIEPDGSHPVVLTNSSGSNTDASWSPDGKYVDYSGDDDGLLGNGNIYIVPASGGKPLRVTRTSNEDGASSWSPDGYIAFESHPSDDAPSAIYRIRVPKLP
jgi:TolB protein